MINAGSHMGWQQSSAIREMYRLVQKKGTVLLSTSLAWLAVAGCSRAETFTQLSSISFAQPCTSRLLTFILSKKPIFLLFVFSPKGAQKYATLVRGKIEL